MPLSRNSHYSHGFQSMDVDAAGCGCLSPLRFALSCAGTRGAAPLASNSWLARVLQSLRPLLSMFNWTTKTDHRKKHTWVIDLPHANVLFGYQHS